MYAIKFTIALRDAIKLNDLLTDANRDEYKRVCSVSFMVDEENEDYWYDKLVRNGIEITKKEFIY